MTSLVAIFLASSAAPLSPPTEWPSKRITLSEVGRRMGASILLRPQATYKLDGANVVFIPNGVADPARCLFRVTYASGSKRIDIVQTKATSSDETGDLVSTFMSTGFFPLRNKGDVQVDYGRMGDILYALAVYGDKGNLARYGKLLRRKEARR